MTRWPIGSSPTSHFRTRWSIYAAQFYGESSALFYRKDILQKANVTMPDKPTWDQVAAAAKAVHNPPNQFGICLRGLPGWGEQLAPLDTVINTFGGRWFDETWKAQLDSPESSAAIKFYIDTVKNTGEPGATQAGFTECEPLMVQGKVGMWYDATSAGDLVFDPKQNPSASNMAMAYAPTKEKPDSVGCGPGRSPWRPTPRTNPRRMSF